MRGRMFKPVIRSLAITLAVSGCGVSVFNPAFVNSQSGGVHPVTPGPGAAFVLVRVVNDTVLDASFVVSIERSVLVRNEDGTPAVDDFGNPFTEDKVETKELDTVSTPPGNENGHLFPCGDSPVNVVGLGDDLADLNSTAVFLRVPGSGGLQGFGISAREVPPLSREAGNFNCGDTIIFHAFSSQNSVGGVGLRSLLLRGEEQPAEFSGASTFETAQSVLETLIPENNP